MARFVIALTQTSGYVLVIAAVWQIIGPWPALLIVGVTLLLASLGAERAMMERR